jgi:hypothetical protein
MHREDFFHVANLLGSFRWTVGVFFSLFHPKMVLGQILAVFLSCSKRPLSFCQIIYYIYKYYSNPWKRKQLYSFPSFFSVPQAGGLYIHVRKGPGQIQRCRNAPARLQKRSFPPRFSEDQTTVS